MHIIVVYLFSLNFFQSIIWMMSFWKNRHWLLNERVTVTIYYILLCLQNIIFSSSVFLEKKKSYCRDLLVCVVVVIWLSFYV